MEFTNDFFIQAQGVIERVFREFRQELLDASGSVASEAKADKTLVTHLDKKIESELKAALQAFHAAEKLDIGIEGEEFGAEGSRSTFWLIDPIDGTDAFIRGTSYFRNMATLIHEGRAIFTLIYVPVSDELYVAAEGEGAFRNGKPISVSKRTLQHTRLEVHAPVKNMETWQLMGQLAQAVGAVRASGDFITVAEGKVDGLLSYKGGGGVWDFAPRTLLIQEAGGKVANIGSSSYDYRNFDFLAANPVIFDDLMKLIDKALADM
jgi:myo-inositol-1(or 4)-monophosphatase